MTRVQSDQNIIFLLPTSRLSLSFGQMAAFLLQCVSLKYVIDSEPVRYFQSAA